MTEEFIEIVTANIADIERALVEQARIETYMMMYMNDDHVEFSRHVKASLVYALDTLQSLLADKD